MCEFDKNLFDGKIAEMIESALGFRKDEYEGTKDYMIGLADHQHPEILMIGCSDSRVDPALICGAKPGDIFTIRNVANLVPPYDTANNLGHGVGAAIEYGVKALNVSNIVVFGHAHCGGIKAAIDTAAGNAPEFDFIGPWLTIAEKACRQEVTDPATGELKLISIDQLRIYSYLVERQSVLYSIENLKTYPWIKDRVDAGNLSLHGWWFDLESGDLWVTNPVTGQFLPVEGY